MNRLARDKWGLPLLVGLLAAVGGTSIITAQFQQPVPTQTIRESATPTVPIPVKTARANAAIAPTSSRPTLTAADRTALRERVMGRPLPTPDATGVARVAATHVAALKTRVALTPVRSMADETRGRIVHIAGRSVQLPIDAAVTEELIHVGCGDGWRGDPCPEVPSYRIERGKSSVYVGLNTGRLAGERTAPGEEHAFDFLREVLR